MIKDGFIIGNKIPREYFISKGFGDTDTGWGNKPWEAGSFDIAERMAQIADFNIVKCSSNIPPEAQEIPIERLKDFFHHGAVLEAILVQTDGNKGQRICAGIGLLQVRKISDGLPLGGYAAEYSGNGNENEAKQALHAYLTEQFKRRFDPQKCEFFNEKFCIQEHTIQHAFGTALAVIGFVSYIYPVIGKL